MFTFVIAKCLRIYAATAHSWHLSTHLVILVTWVYALTSADINIRDVQIVVYDVQGLLLFIKQVHICSHRDDWSGTKGQGVGRGAYMLVI